MCYSFFSLLSFCYRAYRSVNPRVTCFTWSHPRLVAFQFNQEPSSLLRYRHLAFSRFVSFHFAKSRTNPKHHWDWKIQTSSTKYWSRPHLSFLYSINLELQSEKLATTGLQQIYGTVNSSVELLLTVCPKKSVTQVEWISVLISHQPTIRSKTETSKKYFQFHENPIFQKNFEST